ncbi:MAG: sigma-70 family RNA polymerase sigma factor [Candidatus Zixiibacteriota bacterium]|nr:MAG: sigma-70 family RNA polymerase sigma factor [candidate division Zixibacteria bacterium]
MTTAAKKQINDLRKVARIILGKYLLRGDPAFDLDDQFSLALCCALEACREVGEVNGRTVLIARRRFVDEIRRLTHRGKCPPGWIPSASSVLPEDMTYADWMSMLVDEDAHIEIEEPPDLDKMLRKLRPFHRDVILASFFEDEGGQRRLAEDLGISENAVSLAKRKALDQLREMISHEDLLA